MSVLNQILLASSGSVFGALEKALDMKSSNLAYLNRTFGTASTNGRKAWTFSVWVKYKTNGANQTLFVGYEPSTAKQTAMLKRIADDVRFYNVIAGANGDIDTVTTYTSTSVYFHHVFVWDSSNATSNDRMRIYTDGSRNSVSTSSFVALDAESFLDTSSLNHSIGRFINKDDTSFTADPLDAYIARPCFIEGLALGPDSFAGTYGGTWTSKSSAILKGLAESGDGNSFFLDFDNGSSTTTLGYDKSSRGNHWTLNNMTTSDWVAA